MKFKVTSSTPEFVDELKKRFLYRQAIEAARCFEENVVTDPREADVGAILGWGFAPYTGGPLSLIDTVGTKKFVEECDRLGAEIRQALHAGQTAARHGGEGRHVLRPLQAGDEEGGLEPTVDFDFSRARRHKPRPFCWMEQPMRGDMPKVIVERPRRGAALGARIARA